MPILPPTPSEAMALRAEFAGNPKVDRAERAMRSFGADNGQPIERIARALARWTQFHTLSGREAQAVLARFIDPPRAEHRTKLIATTTGYDWRCGCGVSGWEPTDALATQAAARHVEATR
jgi:hypothetical protein